MLYLLKSPTWKQGFIRYKVGYAKDVQNRLKQYEPDTYLIGVKSGDQIDEQILHKRLKRIPGITVVRNEWYLTAKDDLRIINIFHESKNQTNRIVWGNLDSLSRLPEELQDRLTSNLSNEEIFRKDRDSLFSFYQKTSLESSEEQRLFFKRLSVERRISGRLKILCEYLSSADLVTKEAVLKLIPDCDEIKLLYTQAGPERCKANSYAPKRILKELGEKQFSRKELSDAVYKEFSVFEKPSVSDVKVRLKRIFKNLGYTKAVKATDLLKYFEVREFHHNDPVTKKRTRSYELLKKLY